MKNVFIKEVVIKKIVILENILRFCGYWCVVCFCDGVKYWLVFVWMWVIKVKFLSVKNFW